MTRRFRVGPALVALLVLMVSCAPRSQVAVSGTPPAFSSPTATVSAPPPSPTPTPTVTAQPLVPTPMSTGVPTIQAATPTSARPATAIPGPTATPEARPSGEPPATVPSPSPRLTAGMPKDARSRIGVGLPLGSLTDYQWGAGWPGWYLNWNVVSQPPQPPGTRFVQMVRLFGPGFRPELSTISETARTNVGALWLIGNEPDVVWQDNSRPEQYVVTYHTVYQAIKEADPSAQVAIAGVSQPTALRMDYLDRVLESYRAQYGTDMPVDFWNVHAFILREERDSWGIGIPPGFEENSGDLFEIGDHADMQVFARQIVAFRQWMADNGFRDKPLLVSEYGILMPESYWFPPDLVGDFMADSFDYLLTARDEATGYSADDYRLVQAFCWYSASDTMYPTSNLFDPATRQITQLGQRFTAYIQGLP